MRTVSASWAILVLATTISTAAPAAVGKAPDPRRLIVQKLGDETMANALVGVEFPTTNRTLLSKARPDECFSGIDDPANVYPATAPCAVGTPKVNQGYVWSLAPGTGADLWFGTVANPHCAVIGQLAGLSGGSPSPILTGSYACEFTGGNPLDDVRPPKIFLYRSSSRATEDKTPTSGPAATLAAATAGFRAAGTHDGIVFVAGPARSPQRGLNFFAYDTSTRSLVGAATVGAFPAGPPSGNQTAYVDVRSMIVVNGRLYAGVRFEVRDGTGTIVQRGGKILRWLGSPATPFPSPAFQEVGELDSEAAYLAEHQGHIAVTTWPVPAPAPALPGTYQLAGLYVSPALGGDGQLDATDLNAWTKVWQVDDYEPDPVAASVTAGGALASFAGRLYWSTMVVPFAATITHFRVYDSWYDANPPDQNATLEAFLGTQRNLSLFRATDVTVASPAVELLYGFPGLPVFDGAGSWSVQPNNMGGASPTWGTGGLGNPFNTYGWSMAVHSGRLWLGTFDWSYLLYDLAPYLLESLADSGVTLPPLDPVLQEFLECLQGDVDVAVPFGADLYFFPDADSPAFPESISGVGNYTSYGVRNMISTPSGLILGMANPMNLLTDTADDKPEGGWELIRLTDRPQNTPVGTDVSVPQSDGSTVTWCEVEKSGYTVLTRIPLPCCDVLFTPPPGFTAPTQAYLLGTSAGLGDCAGPSEATVCVPANSGSSLFQTLLLPPAEGEPPVPTLVDITTLHVEGFVCGAIRDGSQDALAALGYHGYRAVLVPLPRAASQTGVPTLSGWGVGLLASLLGLAGVFAVRSRLG